MGNPLWAALLPSSTKRIDRIHHRCRDEALSLWRFHREFLVSVNNGSGLEEGRGHARVLQHDQLVVAIDTCFGIQQCRWRLPMNFSV
jgi:hypothetical protein